MAESVGSAEVDIIGCKSVQELALDSENLPPNNYIYNEGGVGFRDALLPSQSDLHIPVVDIGKLTFPSTAQEELHKLHSALSSWGLFQIMSNGIFKSPIHRAVINAEKERFTLAMFCVPDSEKQIKPVDKLVNESRPKLYRPIKNYVEIYFQYYQQGKRAIEASKI